MMTLSQVYLRIAIHQSVSFIHHTWAIRVEFLLSSLSLSLFSLTVFDLTEGLAEARRDNRRRRANLRANGGIEDVESGDGSDDSDDEDGDSEDGWIDVNSTNDEDDDNEQAQADSSSSDDEIMEIRFEPF